MLRHPPDILITTPESLFLLLTSRARAFLESVETVIVDEIHAVVGTKRGAHLALTLERLEELARRPLQRIGLSATQRPLEEVARYLGGGEGLRAWKPRPVTIVDAGARKVFDLRVEVPVEDMARLGEAIEPAADEIPEGPASVLKRRSIWPAIHPRLLELVRAHRSTILFVNSRRLAERLAAALNELAGEEIARAHHGSIARDQRLEIEDALKAGRLPALVATSSLELGIDMGAVDLVVQIETPTSVASGMQRIGRASHQVEAVSRGIIFPKYRGDLLASAAITKAMKEGAVEETRVPQNPLDVLAQHLAADGRPRRAQGGRALRPLAPRGAVLRPGPGAVRGRPRHALGPLPLGRVRRAASPGRVGPPPRGRQAARGHAAARRPERGHHPRPGPLRRLPRRRRRRQASASASSTRRWSSRAARARSSSSAPRAGGSPRSRATACSSCRPPASRGRCRSGRPTGVGGRWRWAARSAASPASSSRRRGKRPTSGCSATTTSTRWPRRTSSPTSRTSARRPACCRTIAPSCSSGPATRWGTGGSASCPRGAVGSTRRGRPRSRRGCARRARPRSSRSGATTGSCSGCRSASVRRRRRTSCPSPRRSRTSWCASWAGRASSPRASARRRAARSSCRAAAPGTGRRCGCRGSAPTTSCRWPRATPPSRSSSRPTASACATCSTCRGWWRSPRASAAARSAS